MDLTFDQALKSGLRLVTQARDWPTGEDRAALLLEAQVYATLAVALKPKGF